MGKKIILLIFFLTITHLLFAQIRSYDNLFFELYNTEDNVFFSDSIEPGWSKTAFGRRVKYEYITVKSQPLLIVYTSVCSGLSCWNIDCYKKYDDRWYLAAKTLAYTPFSPLDSFSTYFDAESNNIVIEFDGKILGRLNERFISGKMPTNLSDNGTVSFINNSVPYIIDIDNHIVYKTNSDTTLKSPTVSSALITNNGDVFYKVDDNLEIRLDTRQYLKKNVAIGYFNPSESPDKKTIVCEQRISKGKKHQNILKSDIVVIDIKTKAIKVLGMGKNPQYCPTDCRYILYHSDNNCFYIFDTELDTNIISFEAQNAVWIPLNNKLLND